MKTNYGRDISKLANQIKRQINLLITKIGLPGAQGRTLHFLAAHQDEDMYQKDIEEEFNLRPSTATGLLQALEKEGYIHRYSCKEDGRLKKIVLDKKADDIARQANDDLLRLEKKLLEGIDPQDLKVFERVLQQMFDNIKL
ncbi:MarR family winged helix-turn-helix transcriptional regulator [uncultured Thomasclavelia sp.]|uniref:MarR family winged helix-turn-helix transcriptional regulator n=1 Tax=uncultured Thomasclavelia sp. TaxID=3025759 RepID=UPI0025D3A65B|nr:MarR family transcriptional regulator [uncultured Thomasclavelia sp.]